MCCVSGETDKKNDVLYAAAKNPTTVSILQLWVANEQYKKDSGYPNIGHRQAGMTK